MTIILRSTYFEKKCRKVLVTFGIFFNRKKLRVKHNKKCQCKESALDICVMLKNIGTYFRNILI